MDATLTTMALIVDDTGYTPCPPTPPSRCITITLAANALVRVRGSARTAAINDTLRLTELLKVDGDTVTTDFDLSRL